MRKTNLYGKFLMLINSILATALLLSFALPYISPNSIPTFSVLSIFVPFLIISNVVFLIYWLLKLHKNLILSLLVLSLGWYIAPPFFKFSKKEVVLNKDLKVLSFNVRMFNHYRWDDDVTIEQQIYEFINQQNVDVVALQEFYNSNMLAIKLPHKYIKTKSKNNKFGLAIYSKYPIINSGSLNFKESANNTIFVDILKGKDTIRVYNVHLESLKINPKKENFGQQNSEKLLQRLSKGFKKQASQTELIIQHQYLWKGKLIMCGDFNNTAYSWAYKQLIKNKKDTFVEAGFGMGKSFRYVYPLRIDFILTDTKATVNQFKTYSDIKLSDHYPITARFSW